MWGPNNGAWRIPLDASGNWTHIDDNVMQLANDNDSLYAPIFNDVPGFRLRSLSRIKEPAVRALTCAPSSSSSSLVPSASPTSLSSSRTVQAPITGYIEDSRGLVVDIDTNIGAWQYTLLEQARKLDAANTSLSTCEAAQAQAKRSFLEEQRAEQLLVLERQRLALEKFTKEQESHLAKIRSTVASVHQDNLKITANFSLFIAHATRQAVTTTSECIYDLSTLSATCHAPTHTPHTHTHTHTTHTHTHTHTLCAHM